MESCRILVNPWDVDRRLGEFDLTRNAVLIAVKRGVLAAAACTPNHPPSFPGISLWAEAMCGLADERASVGFRRVNEGGQPLIIHPTRDLAFTVAAGDEFTGIEGGKTPATKSSKGPRTVEAVRLNLNGWLFPEMQEEATASAEESARIERARRNTWFLLIYLNIAAQVYRCELSLPTHLDDQQRIDDWSERILLGEFPFGDGARAGNDGGEPPMTDEITLEVKRRA